PRRAAGLRPRLAADRLVGRRARQGAGVGAADHLHVPHPRHPAGGGGRAGDPRHRPGGERLGSGPVTVRIAVLGLGEAGSEIGRDLVAAGADVRGYDPKVATVEGVAARGSEAEAVADADLVLSVNSSHDAMTALSNAL